MFSPNSISLPVSIVVRNSAYALLSLVLLLTFYNHNSKKSTFTNNTTTWSTRADSAQSSLDNVFWTPEKKFYLKNNDGNTFFNYWWQAQGLDVLLDGYQRTHDTRYLTRMRQLQQGIYTNNGNTYINEYYDDMAWQAIACLRAFELTKEQSYKVTALSLWADIKTGWNKEQGGGIAWRKTQRDYKNTPANAPAIILAARLYLLDHSSDDLMWAKKLYKWQKQTLVDPITGNVWDGINRSGDGKLDKDWHFTYNQGVYIGACLALYHATRQADYLNDALRTASFVINDYELSPNGILKDEGNDGGGLFKGIFVRYLTLLARDSNIDNATRATYIKFLKNNGESLWKYGTRRSQCLFSTNWTDMPSYIVDGSTQMSGVMMLEALADLESHNFLQ